MSSLLSPSSPSSSSSSSPLSFPRIGTLPSGPCDNLADAGPLRVGHCTLDQGAVQTGVTVILPDADPWLHRPLAAWRIFNGFGKSAGLMQVAELGCLETPLALTNTLAVGTVSTALIRRALATHAAIGREWPTVNPLVLECNDGYLNDIRSLPITPEHLDQAVDAATQDFAQGSVGAGRGMSCFGLKGGIGSASRQVCSPNGIWTVGALVLANFGKPEQCILAGRPLGPLLKARLDAFAATCDSGSGLRSERSPAGLADTEKGSIIMVLATDAPLDVLQLGRLAQRAGVGLARTGSIYGHGSGDLALAFSTSQHLPWPEPAAPLTLRRLPDTQIDPLFQAAAEAVEQAIVKALFLARTVIGRDGHTRFALAELCPDWQNAGYQH